MALCGFVAVPVLAALRWLTGDSIRDLGPDGTALRTYIDGGLLIGVVLLLALFAQLIRLSQHAAGANSHARGERHLRSLRCWALLTSGLVVLLAALFWTFEDSGDRLGSSLGTLLLFPWSTAIAILSRRRRPPAAARSARSAP